MCAGWRVGWAIAPASISAAIANIHVKMTDSAPAPFQEAALVALQSTPSFFMQLRKVYLHHQFHLNVALCVTFETEFF